MISWRTGQTALNGVQELAMSSVEGVSGQLQDSLITSVHTSLEGFVEKGEAAMDQVVFHVQATGVLSQDGTNQAPEVVAQFGEMVFVIVKSSPWMFMMNLSLFSDIRNGSGVRQAVVYARLNFNYLTQQASPTLYATPVDVNPSRNLTYFHDCMVNSTTGQPMMCYQNRPYPYRTPISPTQPTELTCQWSNVVSFFPVLGVPYTSVVCGLPFFDGRAVFAMEVSINTYTISRLLLSLAPTPVDRLFLIFRTPYGTLVGASHGKFFSHSDINFDENNPLKNPPPIAKYQLFSAVNSTDETIAGASRMILEQYHDWSVIPEISTGMNLSAGVFTVRSAHIASRYGLKWQVFLLISADSRVGPVLEKHAEASEDIRPT
eukprot:RCo016231